MYPITSKSSSGIIIIFLVFSEIQSFVTENDTSTGQFCTNANASTKEWLKNYSENNKGCLKDKFGGFGGLSNRLRELPGEILEDNRNSNREILMERNIQQSFPQFRVKYGTEPRNSNQQQKWRSFVQQENSEKTNTRQIQNTRGQRSLSQRSLEDIRTNRKSRDSSQLNTRRNADSRLKDTNRVSSEKIVELERSLNRQSKENRLDSRSYGRSSRGFESRMEERRAARTSTDELRSVNRIRLSRMVESEPRTQFKAQEFLGTRRFNRENSNFETTRRSMENLRRSSDRQVFSRNSPRGENRLRSYGNEKINLNRVIIRDRSELHDTTRTRRNTREGPDDIRSRENSSNLRRSNERLFLPRGLSRAQNTLRSSRRDSRSSKTPEEQGEERRNGGEGFRIVRQTRMDNSEPRSLSRNPESLGDRRFTRETSRSKRSSDRQLFSTRVPIEFSEQRRQDRINTRASADGSRIVNRTRENERVCSEARNSSKNRVFPDTRSNNDINPARNSRGNFLNSRRSVSSSGAENRLRNSRSTDRVSTKFSENQREQNIQEGIRETRMGSFAPRSLSRDREYLGTRRLTRENSGMDSSRKIRENLRRLSDRQVFTRNPQRDGSRFRSNGRNLEDSENRREERINSRASADGFRSVNRIRATRMVGSEPRSLSRDREALATNRFTRENSGVDPARKSRENLGRFSERQLLSRSPQGDGSRFRSNERNSEGSEIRREERMNSRASADSSRSVNRIRGTRMDASEPRSLSRDREHLGKRRFTRENSGVEPARNSRENLGRFSGRQLFSRSSQRDAARFRSNRRNSEGSEIRREERMNSRASADSSRSVNRIRGTRMDASEPRSLSRSREALATHRFTRENFDVDSARKSRENLGRFSERQLLSKSSQRDAARFRSNDNRREGRMHFRTSEDDSHPVNRIRETRMDGSEPRNLSRDRVYIETRQFTRENSVKRSRENLGRSSERQLLSRTYRRDGSSFRSNDRNSRSSELRSEQRMNSRTSAHDSRSRIDATRQNLRTTRTLSNSRENHVNTRRIQLKTRDVSKILDSTRNLRNVPIEHQRKMTVPILGKYSRNGETLEKILPEETSAWFRTIQISLVVVLAGQLFLFNGNKKIGFSGMNLVGMLKSFRA